jgi:hypothetical protein
MNRNPNYHEQIRLTEACKTAAATGKKLDKAFLEVVSGPIYGTWNEVAADVASLGGRMTYSGNIEVCIDADRLWYGKQGRIGDSGYEKAVAADEAVRVAIDTHGYEKVLRFLARNIKLGV